MSQVEAEACEWDPDTGEAAVVGGGCKNPATVVLGAVGEWHLCESCAALPVFKRFKVRRNRGVRDARRD